MAVLKLLFQLTQTKVHNSITKCQLIRYIKQSFLINPMLDQKTVNVRIEFDLNISDFLEIHRVLFGQGGRRSPVRSSQDNVRSLRDIRLLNCQH